VKLQLLEEVDVRGEGEVEVNKPQVSLRERRRHEVGVQSRKPTALHDDLDNAGLHGQESTLATLLPILDKSIPS
jgi:hypothetical protein